MRLNPFLALAALILVVCVVPMPASAGDGTVAVPLGDWITLVLGWLSSILLTVASWAVARWAPAAVRTYLTEQLLSRSIDYALGAVAGAAKGKVLTIPVANQVLETALDYAVANAPKTVQWLGETATPKLIARLSASGALPAEASKTTLSTR